jgi:conjugative transfer pilus assembly protein TraH
MLQQIGNATVGLLFKAALAAINPLIESKLAELGMDVKMEGIFSRNSCQMAQSLVNGVAGMTGMSSANSCVSMARSLYGDDDAAARRRCKTDAVAVNSDARGSSDPDAQALADRDINVMWHALRATTFTRDEKETLLNIAGSVILRGPLANGGDQATPQVIDAPIDSIAVFLYGHEGGSSTDLVKIKGFWKCPDADCLSPTREDVEITPFTEMVRQRLFGIADKMQTRTALNASDISLINHTTVPVHRMLRLGYQAGPHTGLDLQQLFIARFSQVIALDYAHTFLVQTLKNARTYLGAAELKGSAETDAVKDIRARLDRAIAGIDTERERALNRVGNIDVIVTHLERTERQMRQSIGGPARTMLDFGALMAGKGQRG